MSIRDFIQDAQLRGLEAEQRAADGVTTDALGSLAAQVAALKQEVERQNIALTVLTQVLIERSAVDGGQLKARFDQAVAQAAARANFVTCARCKKQIDKRATQLTGSGAVCDACYQAINAEE